MYKDKTKFKKYDKRIEEILRQKYAKDYQFNFASKCAVALSNGTEPTKVYLDNKGMYIVNGGDKISSSEIFSEVMDIMKLNVMF